MVLTNEKYNDIVLTQLPELKPEQLVLEPMMRNTAPCILYASLKIKKKNPNALMIVAPSDHWIEDEISFAKNVEEAFQFCKTNDSLVTLGIKPTFANTGFGYIEYNKEDVKAVKKVVQFREKPDYETANKFLESGNFLWNAGIFIWSVQSIENAFKKFKPTMYQLFMSGYDFYQTSDEKQFIAENYRMAENISIDYAVLERAKNVFVLEASFDWNDLGTWGSLHEKLVKDSNNNAVVNATVILENSSNNIIRAEGKKLVVVDGLDDYIIVDKDDVLLIYPKCKEQDIKQIVSKINN